MAWVPKLVRRLRKFAIAFNCPLSELIDEAGL